MTVDLNGNTLKVGDRVRYNYREENYTFTVEEIRPDDVWGSDIPNGEAWYEYGGHTNNKNWHSGRSVIKMEPETPWEGNVLKFRFT